MELQRCAQGASAGRSASSSLLPTTTTTIPTVARRASRKVRERLPSMAA
jgi:hypothetical protein